MADDIRIKDLQSTASYMENDDYLPIDSLALGNRKIPFTGLMDSEDDRLPTTDKTLRGAIDEHEDDISEIKQSLSNLIKTKSIGNVSTSSNGNITISDLNYDDVIALKVTCNFTSYIATFGKASDGSLFIHFTNAAGQIYSGTMTSGTLYYMTR